MIRFLPLLLCLFTFSCINHSEKNKESDDCFEKVEMEVKYAMGFSITVSDEETLIQTHSFTYNTDFEDKIILPHRKKTYKEDDKVLWANATSFCCQSSTHLAYLNQLDRLDLVKGLCGMDYLNDPEVRKAMRDNKAKEICNGEQITTELLLEVSPDLFLIYPFGRTHEMNLEENGIQTLLIAEYLELGQLARLEWIKVFGLLVGKGREANEYFEAVEKQYLDDLVRNKDPETFIMNLPFGESWHMPSSQSVGVEIIHDAGLEYFYSDNHGTENITRSKEEVWSDGTKADYWVIIADRPAGFSMEDLLAEEPVYKEFKAVKENKVIFCNTGTTDYFAKGTIEPHVLLRDLKYWTGELDHHEPTYFFRLE